MGREVTLKGEFWQKKWRPSRILCRVQGLCWTLRHDSADNAGKGQFQTIFLGFFFQDGGVSRGWRLIKDPISVEKSYQDISNLKPSTSCGQRALTVQNNSLKVKHVALKSQSKSMPSRPHRDSTRNRRPKFSYGEFGGPDPVVSRSGA